MFKIRRSILFVALITLPLIVGCSSTPPAQEEGTETPAAESASTSDQVGSAPEDALLADETKPAEETSAAPTEEKAAGDPFKDLEGSTAATAAPTETSTATIESGASGQKTYTVKKGDTLMKIAFSIYGDLDRWKDLQSWNAEKIKHVNQLSPGMTLTYEVPSEPFNRAELAHSYLIKRGDTLAVIADELYGRKMKFKKLQKYNGHLIKNPNKIFAGFVLFYDITQKEMAEAEARRQERLAAKSDAPPPAAPAQQEASAPAAVPAPASETPPPPSVVTGSGVAPQQPPPVATNNATPAPQAAPPPPAPAQQAPAAGSAQ